MKRNPFSSSGRTGPYHDAVTNSSAAAAANNERYSIHQPTSMMHRGSSASSSAYLNSKRNSNYRHVAAADSVATGPSAQMPSSSTATHSASSSSHRSGRHHQIFHPQLELANQYLQESSYEKALQCFLRILQYEPRHFEAIRGVRFIMSRESFVGQDRYRSIVNRLEKVIRGLTLHHETSPAADDKASSSPDVAAASRMSRQSSTSGRQTTSPSSHRVAASTSDNDNYIRSISSSQERNAPATAIHRNGVSSQYQQRRDETDLRYTSYNASSSNAVQEAHNQPHRNPPSQYYDDNLSTSNVSTISTVPSESPVPRNGRMSGSSQHIQSNNFFHSPASSPNIFQRNQSPVMYDTAYSDSLDSPSTPNRFLTRSSSSFSQRAQHQESNGNYTSSPLNHTQSHHNVGYTPPPWIGAVPQNEQQYYDDGDNMRVRDNQTQFQPQVNRIRESAHVENSPPMRRKKRKSSKNKTTSPTKKPNRARPKRVKRRESKSPQKKRSKKRHPYLPSYMQDLPEMQEAFAPRSKSPKKRKNSRSGSVPRKSSRSYASSTSSGVKICEMSLCEHPTIRQSESHVTVYCSSQHKTMMHNECWKAYNRDASTRKEGQIWCPLSWCDSAVVKAVMKHPQHDGSYVSVTSDEDLEMDDIRSFSSVSRPSSARPGSARPRSARRRRPRSAPQRKSIHEDAEIAIAQGSPTHMLRSKRDFSSTPSTARRSTSDGSARRRKHSNKRLTDKDSEITNLKHLIYSKEDQIQQLKGELNELKVSLKDLPKKLSALQTVRMGSNSPRNLDHLAKARKSLGEISQHDIQAMVEEERRETLPTKQNDAADISEKTPANGEIIADSKANRRTSSPDISSRVISVKITSRGGDDSASVEKKSPLTIRTQFSDQMMNHVSSPSKNSSPRPAANLEIDKSLTPKDIHTPNKSHNYSPKFAADTQKEAESTSNPGDFSPASIRQPAKRTSIQQKNPAEEEAAIRIQSSFRGHLSRKMHSEMVRRKQEDDAATTIQLMFRRHHAQNQLQERREARIAQQEKAATDIQRVFRGSKGRRDAQQLQLEKQQLQLEVSAARLIQASVRGYLARKKATDIREQDRSATIIQQNFRRHSAQKARAELQELYRRNAAVTIQSAFRQHQARKQVSVLKQQQQEEKQYRNDKAIVIQKQFRGFKARRDVAQRRAALEEEKKETAEREQAATRIQSKYRQYSAKKEASARRKQLADQNAEKENAAALTIQTNYRRHSASKLASERKKQKEEDRAVDDAAVKIQSNFRRYSASKMVSEMKQEKEEERKSRDAAAVAIQCKYRQYAAHKSAAARRKEMASREAAVLSMQCAARIFLSKRRFAQEQERMHNEQQQREREEASALRIQKHIRGHQARKHSRDLKQKMRKQEHSAIAIQKSFRGHQARKHARNLREKEQKELEQLEHQERSATVIQKSFRGHKARKNVTSLKKRRTAEQKMSKQQEHSAVAIQKTFRGHQARKRTSLLKSKKQKEEKSAITIQRNIRGHLERKKTSALRAHRKVEQQAVLTLQSAVRCFLSKRRFLAAQKEFDEEMDRFIHREKSALTIQKTFRGHQTRKLVTEKHQEKEREKHESSQDADIPLAMSEAEAAIRIQRTARGYLGRKTASMHRKQVQAATRIQSTFRGFLSRKAITDLERIHREDDAATIIQLMFRRHKAQKDLRSRREEAQAHLLLEQQETQARNAVQEQALNDKAIVIQKQFRGFKARRDVAQRRAALEEEKKETAEREQAATRIQSKYRQYSAKKEASARRKQLADQNAEKENAAALTIQTNYRRHSASKLASERKKQQEKEVQNRDAAALTIQCKYRQHAAQKMADSKKRHRTEEKSAVMIQKHARSFLARKHFKKVQSEHEAREAERLSAEQQLYLDRNALLIQRCVRKFLSLCRVQRLRQEKEHAEQQFIAQEKSAVSIQKNYRGYLARNKVALMKEEQATKRSHEADSAVVIQKNFRAHLDRKRVAQMRDEKVTKDSVSSKSEPSSNQTSADDEKLHKSASIIQRQYRSFRSKDIADALREEKRREEEELLHREASCAKIQRTFRAYSQKKRASKEAKEAEAAVTLQRVARGHFARKRVQKMKPTPSKEEEAAVTIQRVTRGHLGRKRASNRSKEKKENDSAAVIQGAWKGKRQRMDYSRSVALVTLVQSHLRAHFSGQQ